jgi:hypothetical protein
MTTTTDLLEAAAIMLPKPKGLPQAEIDRHVESLNRRLALVTAQSIIKRRVEYDLNSLRTTAPIQ